MKPTVDIENLALLARLSLEPTEREELEHELESILHYVEKLNALDTESVEPVSHVHGIKNVYRKDKLQSSSLREKLLQLAPEREGDFIKVPLVIEQDC